MRTGISPGKRYKVLRRSRFRCHYCGAKAGDVELEVDHVVPVARGGTNDHGNLVAACPSCNRGKGTMPTSQSSVPPSTPTGAASSTVDHPWVGMFVVEEKDSCKWNRSGRIESVTDGHAMVLFFSSLDGSPTSSRPVPVATLNDGTWRFYSSYRRFREDGALYWERKFDDLYDRRRRPTEDVLRSMWGYDACLAGVPHDRVGDVVDRIMDGHDPVESIRAEARP